MTQIALRKKPGRKAKQKIAAVFDALRHIPTPKVVCPPDVLADRDRRAAAEYATVTAAFFKDPPPGRSALDQKNAR